MLFGDKDIEATTKGRNLTKASQSQAGFKRELAGQLLEKGENEEDPQWCSMPVQAADDLWSPASVCEASLATSFI